MHRGGCDSSAGLIVPSFEKGGADGSGTHRVIPEGVNAACRSKMAPWAIERAERARRQRGGRGERDKDVDADGGRQHQATTNPMMVTMAAVADNDVDGGR